MNEQSRAFAPPQLGSDWFRIIGHPDVFHVAICGHAAIEDALDGYLKEGLGGRQAAEALIRSGSGGSST
jgi:hypothetical protein